ncbi:MAG: 30S ribosomal protein S12 methylthiotransferase RimO [Bacteroides sp.]|nr:30S ribosomal protein S12 methylthiotransferase RimO [Bacteroides sp.]MCM1447323.1 30S ribosomal protein S12 methylthiotransferase RimO [Bacteroides sp.]MCM1516858.1 30S ribosomal protein S12 methylthiotransferase RimO [Paraprevotella sp.]
MKIDVITLGCSKNLVDSERLMRQLEAVGYEVTHDAEVLTGEIAVVNTCGFIADAQEESINMILELAQRKSEGTLRKLYVMGCLSERFMDELGREIPEVDCYYGKFDWTRILSDLGHEYSEAIANERHLTTPSHYAYLKISEGCNRRCAYCAIPIITGAHRSRPMEDILAEVSQLVSTGVKEFQVIAQELTFYGLDLYQERRIAQLIQAMADIPGVEWIRLHYAYPADFPMELLPVIRDNANVCKYLDIALQHISDNMLGAMHRHISKEETYALISRIREEVPGIHLRTTLMVGFPGETDEDFAELCDFVRWARFERMGAFAYSEELGTPSARLYTDDIPQEVKEERLSRLMRLQQKISSEIQESKVGREMKVIIDRREDEWYIGRSEYDSPEVDPEVLVPIGAGTLVLGKFYNVRITKADDFELYAEPV